MRTITDGGGGRLAVLVRGSEIKKGLGFYTEEADFLQVGVWAGYERGKVLRAHNHNQAERTAGRTQEALFVMRGSLRASIYSEDDRFVAALDVNAGDILVLFAGGHGYEITGEDTFVLEVKNGPFPGVEKDKRFLQTGR
ncbi:MAG: hypothetical protein M0Z75_03245 [Nitrospiraceae bacterium]|nr:hypothetical protein [Nitrospiraceae bacterium]